MVRITKARLEEKEVVVELVEKLLHELGDEGDEFSGIDRKKMFRELDKNQNRFTAFLAKNDGGESIGIMTVVESFAIYAGGNYGVIDEMYVAPAHRSQGIGRLLIEAAKEYGRQKGWCRIDVTAPTEERWQRTMKFYEREGFVFTGPKLKFVLK